MGFLRFRCPEYLCQTNTGLFVFRMKVPLDCFARLHKKEIQYSLKTRCIYTARKHIASILPFLKDLFEGIRQGILAAFSRTDLDNTIKEGIHQAIMEPLVNYATRYQRFTVVVNPNDASIADDDTAGELHSATVSPLPETPHSDTCHSAKAPTAIVATDEPTFSDLQRNFFREKEVSKGWREKTQEDHEAVFNLFREIFGNIIVPRINKTIMRDFKTTIMQLPPNMRKIAKYKKKTVKQIVAMKPRETLSPHTINKYLSRLSNLFSYAVSHGYMTVNPASGLKVKLKSRPDEEREAYSTEDLKKLFQDCKDPQRFPQQRYSPQNPSTAILATETSKPHFHWTPLIALYSGCRLEEICQLHVNDIRQEDGVWVFDINDKLEKNLKTLSSTRLIPIHPHLVDLGLLKYVDTLKSKREQRLFPELHQRRDGYGQVVSRWFHKYKELCGIDKGKTFHSFRHTFITHLKHKQVDPFMIHELDGHTVNSETMGRYGKRYTPEILLREAIEKIDYGILWEGRHLHLEETPRA